MVTAHELRVALKEEAKNITIPADALWSRLHWSLGTAEFSHTRRTMSFRLVRGAKGPGDRRTGPQVS